MGKSKAEGRGDSPQADSGEMKAWRVVLYNDLDGVHCRDLIVVAASLEAVGKEFPDARNIEFLGPGVYIKPASTISMTLEQFAGLRGKTDIEIEEIHAKPTEDIPAAPEGEADEGPPEGESIPTQCAGGRDPHIWAEHTPGPE